MGDSTPKIDRMALNEYLNAASDFRKAALAMDKLYEGLMANSYKLVLGDCAMETALRQLHQRITELDNAVKNSKGNEKKLESEIDHLRIDLKNLRTNLIEYLLTLSRRTNRFNGIFEQSNNEYGLGIEVNERDKSILRWDHMHPDPPSVLGSLQYVELFSQNLEKSRKEYTTRLSSSYSDLKELGLPSLPALEVGDFDFQRIRYSTNLILNAIDINGLCEMTRAVFKFFASTSKLIKTFQDSDGRIELQGQLAERELQELGIQYEKNGKYVCPTLGDMTNAARTAAEDALGLVTNENDVPKGLQALENLVIVLKRMNLCLPSARAFLVELNRREDLENADSSEYYCKLALRVPPDMEHVLNNMATAGDVKNITKELERIFNLK